MSARDSGVTALRDGLLSLGVCVLVAAPAWAAPSAQSAENPGRAVGVTAPAGGLQRPAFEVPVVRGATAPAMAPKSAPAVAPTGGSSAAGLVPAPPWMRPSGTGLLLGGLAAAAVGGAFAWQSLDAQVRVQGAARTTGGVVTGVTQREAAALDARVKSTALGAELGFGAAALLVGAGVTLWLLDAPDQRLALAPSASGVLVVGRF